MLTFMDLLIALYLKVSIFSPEYSQNSQKLLVNEPALELLSRAASSVGTEGTTRKEWS